MKKGLLMAAVLAFGLTSCSVVSDVFGQPKPHGALTVDKEVSTITVTSYSAPLNAAAVVVRGLNLHVTANNNASCYTTLQSDLVYCKFGDLTPYSNRSIQYTGDTISSRLAWVDDLGQTPHEDLR